MQFLCIYYKEYLVYTQDLSMKIAVLGVLDSEQSGFVPEILCATGKIKLCKSGKKQ